MDRKVKIFSAVMLAVFLMMIGATTLHHHERVQDPAETCVLCEAHHAHGGHLFAGNSIGGHCLLCLAKCLPFVMAATAVFQVFLVLQTVSLVRAEEKAKNVLIIHHSLRAPPSIV